MDVPMIKEPLHVQLAEICTYAINNPLQGLYNEENAEENMDKERMLNELNKDENGIRIYSLVENFINKFEGLDIEKKKQIIRSSKRIWRNLQLDMNEKIMAATGNDRSMKQACSFRMYANDENVCADVRNIKTGEDVTIIVF